GTASNAASRTEARRGPLSATPINRRRKRSSSCGRSSNRWFADGRAPCSKTRAAHSLCITAPCPKPRRPFGTPPSGSCEKAGTRCGSSPARWSSSSSRGTMTRGGLSPLLWPSRRFKDAYRCISATIRPTKTGSPRSTGATAYRSGLGRLLGARRQFMSFPRFNRFWSGLPESRASRRSDAEHGCRATVSTRGGQRGRRMSGEEVAADESVMSDAALRAPVHSKPRAASTAAPRRLVVVSNRVGPIGRDKAAQGGLAVGLRAALEHAGGIWFGYSGSISEKPSRTPKLTSDGNVTAALVDLSRRDYEEYYVGYANRVLWPLFHYRPSLIGFSRRDLAGYLRVNGAF